MKNAELKVLSSELKDNSEYGRYQLSPSKNIRLKFAPEQTHLSYS
ncbi:hypothetical protein [Nostoc sp.]